MARPSQLALIVGVYLLGVSIAVARGGELSAPTLLLGGVLLLPISMSVHYANEYADHETDALTNPTAFSGGSGVLERTGWSPQVARYATFTSGLVGLATLLVFRDALPTTAILLLIGILVVGWQYSLGPLRLVWRSLGELTNAVLGGLALPAYGYTVITGSLDSFVLLVNVPFTILVAVNLLETTWPDRVADETVGKRTLVTRLSRRRLRHLYAIGVVAFVASTLLLWGRVPLLVGVATLAPTPLLLWGITRYTNAEQPLPAVVAMVLVATLQTAAWTIYAGLV
jgi:1,4-dihydroxy-2-naphthoate octaprenyltransferase